MWISKTISRSVITAIFALSVITGCSEDNNSASQAGGMPAPSVSVTSVKLEPVGVYREYAARTEASETVNLRARVEGYLESRNFEEGSSVEKGRLLFTIDPAPFQAAVSQAKAALVSAEAEFTRSTADLERGRDLFPKGYISKADMDKLVTREAQANAGVASAKAQLKTTTINLSYTKIHAPFSGLIGKESYSVGSLVGPGSEPLAELIKTNPMNVNFQINEKTLLDYHQASQGKDDAGKMFTTRIKLPNGAIYGKPGTFDFADVKVEQTTGTVDMRVTFPNPNQMLLPGMYVTLIIESAKKTDTPLIPQFAVQENQQGRFVLIVTKENKVETRLVQLGRRIGPMWVVESGLKAGENIIVSGLQKVRPGVVVSPQMMNVNLKTGTLTSATSTSSTTKAAPASKSATPDSSVEAQ